MKPLLNNLRKGMINQLEHDKNKNFLQKLRDQAAERSFGSDRVMNVREGFLRRKVLNTPPQDSLMQREWYQKMH